MCLIIDFISYLFHLHLSSMPQEKLQQDSEKLHQLPPSHQMADLEQQWQNPGWQGFSAVKLVLLPLNAAEPNVGKGR